MSTAGEIATKGDVVSVYRSTPVKQADGSSQDKWARVCWVRMLLADEGADKLQRDWGRDTAATMSARAALDDDIQVDDSILVESGDFEGERYRVRERRRVVRGMRSLALGLASTTVPFEDLTT